MLAESPAKLRQAVRSVDKVGSNFA
jgi:hypothetical protein